MAQKIFFVYLFIVLIPFSLHSQDLDSIDYKVKYRRFGFGFGYNPLFIFSDFNDINAKLKKSNMNELSSNFLMNHSAVLYFYSGIIPNFRLGAIFSTGTKNSVGLTSNINKEYQFSLNFWAISIDYAYPIHKRASAAVGCYIGRGNINHSLSNYSHDLLSWNDIWDEYKVNSPVDSYKRNLESSFLIFSPYLSFEYGIWDFIALKIGGGYLGQVPSKIYLENTVEISDLPNSIRINKFYIQLGILVGIFMD